MKKNIDNNQITRKEAIKKMGKYAALTAAGTFLILNPKQHMHLHLMLEGDRFNELFYTKYETIFKAIQMLIFVKYEEKQCSNIYPANRRKFYSLV